MKNIKSVFGVVFILLVAASHVFGQEHSDELFSKYDNYRESSLTHRRFKHKDIVPLVLKMKELRGVEVEEIGRSVENRAIYMVKMGTGKTPVLLWSQMHGDEPTATAALMDIFNFFRKDDELNDLREKLLSELTIYFIPMLNPDGAERFTRRNALQIDLNRDARRLASPESRILKAMRERTQAKFGFNLHDQQKYYTAGHQKTPATITFLAPAFNPQEDMNKVRGDAAKLIVQLRNMLQEYIPNGVAKWNDDFEPRAFGEMMTKWGTSTVLVESGGYKDDPERQFARKLNFVILLTAFESIADKTYETQPIGDYFKIPLNEKMLNDLMIRRLKVKEKGRTYIEDFSFRQREIQYANATKYYHRGFIEDKGDLLTYFGYTELDADGMTMQLGKVLPKKYRNLGQFLKKKKALEVLKEGYTAIRLRKNDPTKVPIDFPLLVLGKKDKYNNSFGLGRNPSFLLKGKNGKNYAVVNGRLIPLTFNP